MARRFKKVDESVIIKLTQDSLERVGIEAVSRDKAALAIRLILSGIASYFFNSPNDLIDVGFIRLRKNPEKEQIFAADLIKDDNSGVINADTLYRYYTGDLASEEAMKNTMNNFINELLTYSQSQNSSITKLTGNLKKRRN